MEKIALSKNCKKILFQLRDNKRQLLYKDKDFDDIKYLVLLELVTASKLMNKSFCDVCLTEKGERYLYQNPKLKNPSIWDDKKYWINTAISVLALIVAIIALFKN